MKGGAIAAIVIVAIIAVAGIAAFMMMGSGNNDGGNDDVKTYTVSFVTDNGSYVPSQSVKQGDRAVEPITSRSGYQFLGWFTLPNGGSQFSFSQPITKDTTLYAHWTQDQTPTVYYTVTFNANGGTSSAHTQTVASGSYADEPSATRPGYRFDGWFTAASGGSKFNFANPISGNITLYAHWTQDQTPTVYYTVTFNANGGSPSTSQTVAAGGFATAPATPVRSGYTFAGWYTAAAGGSAYAFGAVSGNTTVYAHWDIVPTTTYTVTFNANGGIFSNGSATKTYTVAYGGYAPNPGIPVRSGSTFAGWYTSPAGGSQFSSESAVTSDMSLYARWGQAMHTVTIIANGSGSVSASSLTVADGALISASGSTLTIGGQRIVATPSQPTSQQTYYFSSWSTTSGQVKGDMTITANFGSNANSYTVSFNSNGGSAVPSQIVSAGGNAFVPSNPTKPGYTFEGWFTSIDGKVEFNFSSPVNSNKTAYAHWSENLKTVDYRLNEGHSKIIIGSGYDAANIYGDSRTVPLTIEVAQRSTPVTISIHNADMIAMSTSVPLISAKNMNVNLVINGSCHLYGVDGSDSRSRNASGGIGGNVIECGTLSISGTGTLTIKAGDGGDGYHGDKGSAGYPGTSGSNGGNGGIAVKASSVKSTLSASNLTITGGNGGRGGDGGAGGDGSAGRSGQNGSWGDPNMHHSGNGVNGGKGGDGGAGGNGGAATSCNASLSGNVKSGKGGDGGSGGTGGNGGDGGSAPKNDSWPRVTDLRPANGGNGGDGGSGGTGGKGGDGNSPGTGGIGGYGGRGGSAGTGGHIFAYYIFGGGEDAYGSDGYPGADRSGARASSGNPGTFVK